MTLVDKREDLDTTILPSGQQKTYLVLSDEEIAKGFVRPLRRSYKHVGTPAPKHPLRDLTPEELERYKQYGYVKFEEYPKGSADYARGSSGRFYTQADLDKIGKGCGATTTMGIRLCETYAAKPTFYGATFCSACHQHLPVGEDGEFVWTEDGERVGT